MSNLKKPRQAIPCSTDPDYSLSMADNADNCYPHHNCYPHRKKELEFSCGTASGLSLPVYGGGYGVREGNGPPPCTSLVAGTVSLDTSGMVHPTVKVDFSSLINFWIALDFYAVGLLLSIDFRLSKICDGSKVSLGTWTYQKSVNAGCDLNGVQQTDGCGLQVDFREAFNFSWCECQDCPGCCTYVVEIANVNSFNIMSASLTNVSISAMAVG